MARLGSSYGNLKRDLPVIGPDGTVYVMIKTGGKLWEFETAIGSDGTVYVGSMTKSSMPSMARLGSSYGNLKRL